VNPIHAGSRIDSSGQGSATIAVQLNSASHTGKYGNLIVTIQLTSDLPDSGVKSAHIHWWSINPWLFDHYTARFFLVLEQIRGNLNSYE
jgi:hypothetical protein